MHEISRVSPTRHIIASFFSAFSYFIFTLVPWLDTFQNTATCSLLSSVLYLSSFCSFQLLSALSGSTTRQGLHRLDPHDLLPLRFFWKCWVVFFFSSISRGSESLTCQGPATNPVSTCAQFSARCYFRPQLTLHTAPSGGTQPVNQVNTGADTPSTVPPSAIH
ncbi:hypothetical protein B0T13DRAFT_1784 [Neurospora crassa]|nr:hypothetical protein B0T13DRAFT_1784 [Neurospora crassa]